MALKKVGKRAEEVQKLLPPLTHEQVEVIAEFFRASNLEDFATYSDFCCSSEAIDDAANMAANCIRNAYGIETGDTEKVDDE